MVNLERGFDDLWPPTLLWRDLPRMPHGQVHSGRMRQTLDTPKAMLVDLDDTIIYFPGVDVCWRQVCADGAARVPGLVADDLFREIVRTRDWYWSDPERHRIGRQDLNAASIGIVQGAELVPGAVEALQRFSGHGIGLAMITIWNGRGPESQDRAVRPRPGLRPHLHRGRAGLWQARAAGLPGGDGRPRVGAGRDVVRWGQPGVGGRCAAEAGHLQCLGRPGE